MSSKSIISCRLDIKANPQEKSIYYTSKILDEIDTLKTQLDGFRQFDSYRITQALELEYTFESNRIEGTMTLRETDLVINEGLTISGKMREHLEVINHQKQLLTSRI
jgi:hypothetical protein